MPNAKTKHKPYWTVRQLAEALNFHRDTIYRMCERREIPYHRIAGQIRFSDSQVKTLKKATLVKAREGGLE